jgi:hypothetical protein
MANTVEAFFEVESSRPFGLASYRAGYRCSKTGNAVCALELPASIVETTVLRDARLSAAVGPDGHVRFSLYRADCENMAGGVPSVSEPIDQLIARIVSVDSLHLEEISSADLSSLLIQLCRSVALVQEAMRHLPDQHVQDTP